MGFLDLTGLDIQGDADERDRRSLAEVAALEATNRMIKPTQETTETYLRLHERNCQMVRSYRWEDQDKFTDPDRVGDILGEREFFRRLAKFASIKVNDWDSLGLRGFAIWKDGQWQYPNCPAQCGYATEFSLFYYDDHGLITKEKTRGWRGTVLLRLITGGYVTEDAAHAEFGPPKLNRASLTYRKKLYQYRNRKETSDG